MLRSVKLCLHARSLFTMRLRVSAQWCMHRCMQMLACANTPVRRECAFCLGRWILGEESLKEYILNEMVRLNVNLCSAIYAPHPPPSPPVQHLASALHHSCHVACEIWLLLSTVLLDAEDRKPMLSCSHVWSQCAYACMHNDVCTDACIRLHVQRGQ